jgi:hypothetical protein
MGAGGATGGMDAWRLVESTQIRHCSAVDVGWVFAMRGSQMSRHQSRAIR